MALCKGLYNDNYYIKIDGDNNAIVALKKIFFIGGYISKFYHILI